MVPAETSPDDPNQAIYAAWRAESARRVGALTRMTRDVSLAEDLAQDALVAALVQWPATGVPDNPVAWLMTTAKRRAIDHFRRADSLRRKVAELEHARGREEETMPDVESPVDYIEDDVRRLILLGLQALLEIQGSRMPARLDEDGAPVLLEVQDRNLWDHLLIRRGMAALEKAGQLAVRGTPVGRYFLQASIAAEHARAVRAEDTDWRRIAGLYDVLTRAAPGPVVEVNRAVAHGRAYGPGAGLAVLEEVDPDSLGDSPLVPSVRGDLLERAGMHAQAREAFIEEASRTANAGERTVLQRRADRNRSLGSDPDEPPQPTRA